MKDGFYLDFDGEIAIKFEGEWYYSKRYGYTTGNTIGDYICSTYQEDWEESMNELGFLIVEI